MYNCFNRVVTVSLLAILVSCNSSKNELENVRKVIRKENSVGIENSSIDSSHTHKKQESLDLISENNPDKSIGGLQLLNPDSIERILGNIELNQEDSNHYFPYFNVVNKERTILLTMYFYPGSTRNSFSKFIVEPFNTKSIKNCKIINKSELITDHGIYIGLEEKELLKKLDTTSVYIILAENKKKVYQLDINDLNNQWLKQFNMPLYKAQYIVENNKVVKIEFGFEHP